MRLVSCLLAIAIVGASLTMAVLADNPPYVVSESYIVIDSQTGQVLAAKNENEKLFPASITKILTCALALQKGGIANSVTMSEEAVFSVPRDTTHIALTDDEVVPVEALLNATMIQSANDAANGLAQYVSGDLGVFAGLMNQTAKEAGAINSNFVNASGLHDANHITTAYDMAMITKWGLTVPQFRKLFSASQYTMAPTNKQPSERIFSTKHKMMSAGAMYSEEVLGGKLGWTPEATHTMVTLAKKGELEVICVVMKVVDADQKFSDTKVLLDYVFKNFAPTVFSGERFSSPPIPILSEEGQIGSVDIPPQELRIDRPITLAKAGISIDLQLPIHYKAGEDIAPTVKFYNKGELICEQPLKFETVMLAAPMAVVVPVEAKEKLTLKPWFMFTAAGIALAVVAIFSVRAVNLYRRRRRRREHKRIQQLCDLERDIIGMKPELSSQPISRRTEEERKAVYERQQSRNRTTSQSRAQRDMRKRYR